MFPFNFKIDLMIQKVHIWQKKATDETNTNI